LVGALQCPPFMEGGAAAAAAAAASAMVLSPAWGSPAAAAGPSDHHHRSPMITHSTQLDSLSSPPSATHACTITFILGSRCPRLCLQGLKLACFGEALHETEESRTHQARHIPLAAVSCSILSLFLCFSIVSALHLPLSIFHFYFL
jgi:hypothetical protein